MQQDMDESQGSYERQAIYYDAIYEAQSKNYKRESEQIRDVIEKYKRSSGNSLLDVGCGTGGHFPFLRSWYTVAGLDIDSNMLQVASKRFPGIPFYQEDMANFHLDAKFSAITCLFSAIGYTKTLDRMKAAVKCMEQHLIPGGVLVVEPWLSPDIWNVDMLLATFVDKPELKIARINRNEREGNISVITFHFLVGTPGKVEHFTERHELGLFTEAEYLAAFKESRLKTTVDHLGITGKGLYIGVKQ